MQNHHQLCIWWNPLKSLICQTSRDCGTNYLDYELFVKDGNSFNNIQENDIINIPEIIPYIWNADWEIYSNL